jgi:act minimal PKS acyl carrier protein
MEDDVTEFTLADLTRLMRQAAGQDESVSLDGDIIDVAFTDLGYDSLAIIETANLAQRELGVVIPEGEVADAETPRQFLALVSRQIAASV